MLVEGVFGGTLVLNINAREQLKKNRKRNSYN